MQASISQHNLELFTQHSSRTVGQRTWCCTLPHHQNCCLCVGYRSRGRERSDNLHDAALIRPCVGEGLQASLAASSKACESVCRFNVLLVWQELQVGGRPSSHCLLFLQSKTTPPSRPPLPSLRFRLSNTNHWRIWRICALARTCQHYRKMDRQLCPQ